MRRLILLLVVLLVPVPTYAASAPVQTKATITSSAQTTVSVTLDSAPTSGNTLFAFITRGGAVGLTSVSGGGVTWTSNCSPSFGNTRFYVYSGTTDGSSSTVTVTFGGTANLGLVVVEGNSNYSFEACGALQAQSGTQTTMSSGAITNTSANALVVAFGTAVTATQGAPTGGYTAITTGSTQLAAAYLAVSSSASQSTTWAINSAVGYNALIVSLAESAGGGGGGSTSGGLLLRGVGAALWRGLWPFDGRGPVLGMEPHVGAIRADDVQLQQHDRHGNHEDRWNRQDPIHRLQPLSHLRSFRPERSDLSRASNIAQVRIG